jgi:hypothetical protein
VRMGREPQVVVAAEGDQCPAIHHEVASARAIGVGICPCTRVEGDHSTRAAQSAARETIECGADLIEQRHGVRCRLCCITPLASEDAGRFAVNV